MGKCMSTPKKDGFIMSTADVEQLRNVYDIDQTCLGSGSSGKVFKAENIADRTQKVAIKVINKKDFSDEDMDMLKSEVQLMQQVDDPNIVRYYETYYDKKYIYLVMELCTGGDLFKCIDEGKALTDREASLNLDKCLRALQHCHAQNIIHRDIKPENIMYTQSGEIKLIDFGFALVQKNKKAKMDIAGTPYYIAPEVLSGKYGKECDVWSMGVCLYQLLTGELPFQGTTQKEVFGKIQSGKFTMPNQLTPGVQDLLGKMIDVNPKTRWSTQQCLDHPWIKEGEKYRMEQGEQLTGEEQAVLDQQIVDNLKKYRGKSLLRKAAMNVLVKHLDPKRISNLKFEFEKLDNDNSGFLEANELRQALKNSGSTMDDQTVDEIIKNLDYAGNGQINYSEFISATINVSEFLTDDKLEAIFKTFDIDNTGKITPDNLKDAFSKFGRSVTQAEIDNIMNEHDLDKEGTVDMEEFKKMMGVF